MLPGPYAEFLSQVSKRGTIAPRPDANQSQPQPQHQQAQQQPPEGPSRQQGSEEVPEIVNDRMLKRIIAFSGIPVFIGFSLFPFFYFLKVISPAILSGLFFPFLHQTCGLGVLHDSYFARPA